MKTMLASIHKNKLPEEENTMAIEIEYGIEIPAITRTSNGKDKYPFASMEVGGSFFISDEDAASGDAKKTLVSAVSAAHERFAVKDPNGVMRTIAKGKDAGKEVPVTVKTRSFTVRIDSKDGVPGARVFRIE